MKRIFIIGCLIGLSVPVLHAQEAPGFLDVYDSLTGTVSQIQVDPNLTSLQGKAPEQQEKEENEAVAASVLNGEDWYQVNGKKWPYSAVVHIKKDGAGRCSGAMIGPYTVLTNAHCVYKSIQHDKQFHNNGEMYQPSQLTAYAGGDSSSIHARATRIYAAPGTARLDWGTEFMNKDYAILVLDKPIGNQSGYFGAKRVQFKQGTNIKIVGFPGVKNHRSPWVSPGKVSRVYSSRIEHSADVMAGNSGSPVFLGNDLENVVAVHSFGHDETNKPGNGATANKDLLSFIEKYRDEKPTGSPSKNGNTKQDVVNTLRNQFKHK